MVKKVLSTLLVAAMLVSLIPVLSSAAYNPAAPQIKVVYNEVSKNADGSVKATLSVSVKDQGFKGISLRYQIPTNVLRFAKTDGSIQPTSTPKPLTTSTPPPAMQKPFTTYATVKDINGDDQSITHQEGKTNADGGWADPGFWVDMQYTAQTYLSSGYAEVIYDGLLTVDKVYECPEAPAEQEYTGGNWPLVYDAVSNSVTMPLPEGSNEFPIMTMTLNRAKNVVVDNSMFTFPNTVYNKAIGFKSNSGADAIDFEIGTLIPPDITASPTPTPTPVPTTAVPTDTPTPVPTTAVPTETPTPVPTTAAPTDTPVPTTAAPTATPVPTPKYISGTIKLPDGDSAKKNGEMVTVFANSGSTTYWTTAIFKKGMTSAPYKIEIAAGDESPTFNVSYTVRNTGTQYLNKGTVNASVDVSKGDVSGLDFSLSSSKTITGKISLPEGKAAPAGGLKLSVIANSGTNCYTTYLSMAEGATGANYTITVPAEDASTNFSVYYYVGNCPSFMSYKVFGNVNTSGGLVSGINTTLISARSIKGTIALPAGKTAPANGLGVSVVANSGATVYSTFAVIGATKDSVNYTLTIPADDPNTNFSLYTIARNGDYKAGKNVFANVNAVADLSNINGELIAN